MTTIAALEALARKATPGPWHEVFGGVADNAKCTQPNIAHVMSTRGDFDDEEPNARYIAAADPLTVLRLIERLRRAEEVAEAAKAQLAALDSLDDGCTRKGFAGWQNGNGRDVGKEIDASVAALRSALAGIEQGEKQHG